MSDKINDGGPAFPVPPPTIGRNDEMMYASEGITTRDFFAGHALAGLLAASEYDKDITYPIMAYAYADLMLAERAKAKP